MKKITIEPRLKYILVKPDDEKSRVNDYGIVTPTTVEQEKKSIGIVVSVGKDVKDIKKGAKVIYGAYVGEQIKVSENNKEINYVIIHDEDILAFIHE